MLRNFIVIALRNLLNQKGYSLVKIAGLAFGIAASLVIYLYVLEDLSYNKFNKNYNNIVRLLTIDSAEGVSSKVVGVTQPMLGPSAKEELPEVIESVRITGGGRYDLSYEEKTLKCESALRVDPSFFSVFDVTVIDGPPTGILDDPGSIAITQSLAKKIFGKESAMGKTIKLNQNTDLHVTAVLADPPTTSHLQYDLLRTLVPGQDEQGLQQALETWQGIFCNTYLLLDQPTDVNVMSEKLQAISKKNNAYEFFTPIAQQLSDVHLNSKDILFEINANKSDAQNIYVLAIIGILILILAAVNFVNLVTANSTMRAKEVGVRKVVGALKRQLIGQHLVESLAVTFISGLFALAIVFMIVPLLNSIYQRHADAFQLLEPINLTVMLGIILFLGILAGLYPAFVLSAMKPGQVLKGDFKSSSSGVLLRKSLVVLQFTISIALIVGTGIVFQQMQFIFNADLGYNRDQVITLQQSGPAVGNTPTLRSELLRNENIVNVGTASARIGQQLGRTAIYPEGRDVSETNIITSIMSADEYMVAAMEMEMKAGRYFSPDFDDSLSMVVNVELTKLLGWEDAVGRRISLQSGPNPTDLTAYTVVGVLNDFHFATIRHKLEPMFMLYSEANGAMAIKIKGTNVQETIAYIEETWKKVNPGQTFEYDFLDDQFALLYSNEEAFASMFSHFTLLAMVIAGLGLFALSAYTAQQRRKEIGIRKVLGASSSSILVKLSTEFVILIMISFVLASGIAYFVMSRWLEDFEYSIKIGMGVFILSGAASLLVGLLTVSFQSLKAAWSNPVESLRVE